eukprot:m.31864 g.31864  ORF g.31864 m.31864 type:complete len:953 (+) comp10801_c0_seq2:800-3658(+)
MEPHGETVGAAGAAGAPAAALGNAAEEHDEDDSEEETGVQYVELMNAFDDIDEMDPDAGYDADPDWTETTPVTSRTVQDTRPCCFPEAGKALLGAGGVATEAVRDLVLQLKNSHRLSMTTSEAIASLVQTIFKAELRLTIDLRLTLHHQKKWNLPYYSMAGCLKCGAVKHLHDTDVGLVNCAVCNDPLTEADPMSASGPAQFRPRHRITVIGLSDALSHILNDHRIQQLLDKQANKRSTDGIIRDVYDGSRWVEVDAMFPASASSYKLQLSGGIDAANLFQNKSNVGAVTVCTLYIQNLPVEERYRKENTITFCVYSGGDNIMKAAGMLYLLREQIRDIIKNGIKFKDANGVEKTAYALLHSFVADLPAAALICSSVGCRGKKPCRYCKFQRKATKNDDGKWQVSFATDEDTLDSLLRDEEDVKESCLKTSDPHVSATERKNRFTKYGFKPAILTPDIGFSQIFSVLNSDLLHQLGLSAAAKEVQRILDYLSTDSLKIVLQRLKEINLCVLSDMRVHFSEDKKGRVKIVGKSFQKLAFVSLHARSVFAGLLPGPLYDSISLLAQICDILFQPTFTHPDLQYLKSLVIQHEKTFIDAYGEYATLVCHHLLHHICDDIIRFGPLRNFTTAHIERHHQEEKHTTTSRNIGTMAFELLRSNVNKFYDSHKNTQPTNPSNPYQELQLKWERQSQRQLVPHAHNAPHVTTLRSAVRQSDMRANLDHNVRPADWPILLVGRTTKHVMAALPEHLRPLMAPLNLFLKQLYPTDSSIKILSCMVEATKVHVSDLELCARSHQHPRMTGVLFSHNRLGELLHVLRFRVETAPPGGESVLVDHVVAVTRWAKLKNVISQTFYLTDTLQDHTCVVEGCAERRVLFGRGKHGSDGVSLCSHNFILCRFAFARGLFSPSHRPNEMHFSVVNHFFAGPKRSYKETETALVGEDDLSFAKKKRKSMAD